MDSVRPQQPRLRKKLKKVRDQYDYCIIDNAPDLNLTVINALVATDDVLARIKIDQFGFDGLNEILEQIDEVSEFN
ncbi:ParA family protein, partial [Bacillus paralicheniformis]|uniref:ParA family protein n=1 Tax=Bacillus paralicheniformis TaxID=1648923 RepID=UPI0020BD875A